MTEAFEAKRRRGEISGVRGPAWARRLWGPRKGRRAQALQGDSKDTGLGPQHTTDGCHQRRRTGRGFQHLLEELSPGEPCLPPGANARLLTPQQQGRQFVPLGAPEHLATVGGEGATSSGGRRVVPSEPRQLRVPQVGSLSTHDEKPPLEDLAAGMRARGQRSLGLCGGVEDIILSRNEEEANDKT